MKKSYILITLMLIGLLAVVLTNSAGAAYNYGDVMEKAISWYDANRCGTGVATNNVFSSWRGNCHTSDSVVGGFHDAGDHVKFQLPAAFSASAIGWSIYEFRSTWPAAALTKAWQELKIFHDYSMKCWNGSSMVIQIGDGGADHGYWGPPENQTGSRPTATAAAADIIAQTAASLALMNINYKSIDSAYATTCLNTAKAMFNAVKNSSTRGTAANGFYTSSSHADDLAWASIWLYIATGDNSYLEKTEAWIETKNDPGDPPYQKPWTYCWDDSALANCIMMYKLTGIQKYYDAFMWNFNWFSNTLTKTPYGLPYLNQWAVLRYDSAEAGLMYIVYKNFGLASSYITLANKMIDYTLGTNPRNLCYVTNYGTNSVKHPHHRANEPVRGGATNGMVGALAGGPNSSDGFTDDVNSYEYTEVALDYNASYLLGLAGRKYVNDGGPGGTPWPTPTSTPTPTPAPTIAPGNGTGLVGTYYNGTALAGTPLLTRVDSTVNFNWAGGSPATNVPSDGFSVRWTGQVEARSSEVYTFYLSHDDGARMWVNNVQVVNNWTDHAAVEDSGTIALSIGQRYNITVEFYENSGDASCQLSWSTGTLPKEIIPQTQLYNSSTTPTPTRIATVTPTPTRRVTVTPTPTPLVTPTPTQRNWNITRFYIEKVEDASEQGLQQGRFRLWSTQEGTVTGDGYARVDYTISGTATNGEDYQTIEGYVYVLYGMYGVGEPPAGAPRDYIDIIPISDGLVEGTETVTITLTGVEVGEGKGSATLNITDSTVTPTPTPVVGGNYAVDYVIQSDWGVGATINVTITNNTATAVNGWTLAFTFPGNQTVANLWNGSYTQTGASVSVKDLGYNAYIGANGGSTNFGFNLNYSGSNAEPTSFTLNGTACVVQ